MSHVNSTSFNIQITPKPVPNTQARVSQAPNALFNLGYNMLVEISTASAMVNNNPSGNRSSIAVWAHFDTGARVTTLDSNLAQHLNLISTGSSPINTANGTTTTNNYAVDIQFLNTQLKGLTNLMVSSCSLGGFNLQRSIANQNDPRNFGVLIGRDIMSMWNITWHGPTSTVLISD